MCLVAPLCSVLHLIKTFFKQKILNLCQAPLSKILVARQRELLTYFCREKWTYFGVHSRSSNIQRFMVWYDHYHTKNFSEFSFWKCGSVSLETIRLSKPKVTRIANFFSFYVVNMSNLTDLVLHSTHITVSIYFGIYFAIYTHIRLQWSSLKISVNLLVKLILELDLGI